MMLSKYARNCHFLWQRLIMINAFVNNFSRSVPMSRIVQLALHYAKNVCVIDALGSQSITVA